VTAGEREKPSVLESSSEQEVFRPWRSELIYSIGIFILACCVGVVCYLESTTILESQIALGVNPFEVSRWVAVAILGTLGLFAFWAIRLRRFLLAEGELRLSGSSLSLRRASSFVVKDISDLRRMTSYPGGANVSLWFSERLRLPGQWLPLGWKRTWNGWETPDGTKVRLRRKTHPLLLALRARRADLRLGLAGIPLEVAAGLFCALLPNLGSAPLYFEARKVVARPDTDDIAKVQFQEGNYLQACDTYRRAQPELRHDLYASLSAAEFLLYCGDPKAAVQALVGFDSQVFWPFPPDLEALARIRISRMQYKQAEALLHGQPSYLRYVALAEQGQQDQAQLVLREIAGRDGLARVLLLRRSGEDAQARMAADELCAGFGKHRPWTPSWLARIFESCILTGGASRARLDPRFEPAIRALPGLRAELAAFTAREAPDYLGDLRSVMQDLQESK
jgi:hypothetical protein